jgi:putative endonuclease
MNKRQTGTKWEQLAAAYLESQGYVILATNYRCRLGEIDIIASQNDVIVFVEVKYRSGRTYGTSLEAVNLRKQNTIRKVAQYYLVTVLHSDRVACRFDVVGIDKEEFTLITDAF